MHTESEPEHSSSWQVEHPWLSEPTMPDQDDDTLDEITRYALDEIRIA